MKIGLIDGITPACIGSPPRVRGTAQYYDMSNMRIGITPACAGNSGNRIAGASPAGDHPRVCGEQPPRPCCPPGPPGSTPRVRGTALERDQIIGEYRITPACAGNSLLHKDAFAMQQDHPRVCGEQS